MRMGGSVRGVQMSNQRQSISQGMMWMNVMQSGGNYTPLPFNVVQAGANQSGQGEIGSMVMQTSHPDGSVSETRFVITPGFPQMATANGQQMTSPRANQVNSPTGFGRRKQQNNIGTPTSFATQNMAQAFSPAAVPTSPCSPTMPTSPRGFSIPMPQTPQQFPQQMMPQFFQTAQQNAQAYQMMMMQNQAMQNQAAMGQQANANCLPNNVIFQQQPM